MKSTLFVVTLGFIGLAGAVGTACSSSSTPEVRDTGVKEDTGKPVHDASVKDTSTKTDGHTKGDANLDAVVWPGLDAAFAGVGAPPACESCIGQNCLSQAEACYAASGCVAIEECIWTCIKQPGSSPENCALGCIGGDSGALDTPAKIAADGIATCIVKASCPCNS